MKPVIFSKHAFRRLKERSGVEKYAEKIFHKAELVYTEPKTKIQHYKNGKLRFIVAEMQEQFEVITVIKDK